MATLTIHVVSDFICPWCHIGDARLFRALAMLPQETQVRVRWRPFELNADMPREGLDRREYRTRKFGSWARSLAMDAHVVEAGRREGLAFHYERVTRTPNTFDAHRLAWLAHGAGKQREVVTRIFRAYFEEGRDIGVLQVLEDIGAAAGLGRGRLASFLAGDEGAAEVRALEREQSGTRSVPRFEIDGVLVTGTEDAVALAKTIKAAGALRGHEEQP